MIVPCMVAVVVIVKLSKNRSLPGAAVECYCDSELPTEFIYHKSIVPWVQPCIAIGRQLNCEKKPIPLSFFWSGWDTLEAYRSRLFPLGGALKLLNSLMCVIAACHPVMNGPSFALSALGCNNESLGCTN